MANNTKLGTHFDYDDSSNYNTCLSIIDRRFDNPRDNEGDWLEELHFVYVKRAGMKRVVLVTRKPVPSAVCM